MGYLKPIKLHFLGVLHDLASSNLVRLSTFEIVRHNNNHALKFRYVLNRIIKTFQMVHFFTEDQPRSFCWDLTKPL